MRYQLLTMAMVLMAATACSEPTAAGSDRLIGRWQNAPESLNPRGSYQRTMTFGADGSVIVDVRMYGLYSDQSPNDVASYTQTFGSYRTFGDSLAIRPEHIVWWDRFYGSDSPVHMEDASPNAELYSKARYHIAGNRLTLDYLSYPADAPVPTTATYIRAQ